MKKLKWKKVTPVPPEMNGHGFLWDCPVCGYCLTYAGERPDKVTCPRCGFKETEEKGKNVHKN